MFVCSLILGDASEPERSLITLITLLLTFQPKNNNKHLGCTITGKSGSLNQHVGIFREQRSRSCRNRTNCNLTSGNYLPNYAKEKLPGMLTEVIMSRNHKSLISSERDSAAECQNRPETGGLAPSPVICLRDRRGPSARG